MDRPTIAQIPVAFAHYPSNRTTIPTATVAYSSSCIPTNIPILPGIWPIQQVLLMAIH